MQPPFFCLLCSRKLSSRNRKRFSRNKIKPEGSPISNRLQSLARARIGQSLHHSVVPLPLHKGGLSYLPKSASSTICFANGPPSRCGSCLPLGALFVLSHGILLTFGTSPRLAIYRKRYARSRENNTQLFSNTLAPLRYLECWYSLRTMCLLLGMTL